MTLPSISRRTALAGILSLAAAPLTVRAAANPKVSVALDWTPNTNHVGLYVARDRNFYRDAGLDVEILPYTDASAATLVASRVADFGVLGSIGLMTQRAAGADLIGTFAIVQKETGRVVFKADRSDIRTPKDLDGKTYGGFGSAWENALLGSMIRKAGGKGEFETVTLGTSAYQALDNGAVDFTLEVYTWEGVQAEMENKAQRAFVYADYGVPDEHTAILGSSNAYLAEKPDLARAFMQATRKGYEFAADHPDEAADILIKGSDGALTNGELVRASLKALVDGAYLRTAPGKAGDMEPAKMADIGNYLFDAGILKDANGAPLAKRPDFSAAFTNGLLAGS